VDRKWEMEARPASGSATPPHKLTASQSNGAGNANPDVTDLKNGMFTIMGGRAHQPNKTSQANERVEVKVSRTPDPAVRAAKKKRTDREEGRYPRDGGWGKK